jgi:hypothetical protein
MDDDPLFSRPAAPSVDRSASIRRLYTLHAERSTPSALTRASLHTILTKWQTDVTDFTELTLDEQCAFFDSVNCQLANFAPNLRLSRTPALDATVAAFSQTFGSIPDADLTLSVIVFLTRLARCYPSFSPGPEFVDNLRDSLSSGSPDVVDVTLILVGHASSRRLSALFPIIVNLVPIYPGWSEDPAVSGAEFGNYFETSTLRVEETIIQLEDANPALFALVHLSNHSPAPRDVIESTLWSYLSSDVRCSSVIGAVFRLFADCGLTAYAQDACEVLPFQSHPTVGPCLRLIELACEAGVPLADVPLGDIARAARSGAQRRRALVCLAAIAEANAAILRHDTELLAVALRIAAGGAALADVGRLFVALVPGSGLEFGVLECLEIAVRILGSAPDDVAAIWIRAVGAVLDRAVVLGKDDDWFWPAFGQLGMRAVIEAVADQAESGEVADVADGFLKKLAAREAG